jgi:hypothetical protein
MPQDVCRPQSVRRWRVVARPCKHSATRHCTHGDRPNLAPETKALRDDLASRSQALHIALYKHWQLLRALRLTLPPTCVSINMGLHFSTPLKRHNIFYKFPSRVLFSSVSLESKIYSHLALFLRYAKTAFRPWIICCGSIRNVINRIRALAGDQGAWPLGDRGFEPRLRHWWLSSSVHYYSLVTPSSTPHSLVTDTAS